MRADSSIGIVEAIQQPKEHPKYYDPVTHETGWCSGGGALISTKALRKIGLFDERFFLYCEDVDLSWRMWLSGWKCKVNPQATYKHFTEDQDKEKDMSVQQYHSMRNCFYMHYKYDSAAGIQNLKKLFFQALNLQPDEKSKHVMMRAYNDARKARFRFISDRISRVFQARCKWIMFNDFAFELRRDFIDTPEGARIIAPLPSNMVKE